MIYLTKGQTLATNQSMVVYDPTGYYEDGSSVVCASVHSPEDPVCRYEAKFIAYGDMVYTIAEPEKLMTEILALDPKSLFGKTNESLAVDRVVENIRTVTPTETPESTLTTPEQVETALATTTPLTTTNTHISTTTPVTPEIPTEHPLEEITPILENVIEDLTQVSNVVETVSSTTPPLTEIAF